MIAESVAICEYLDETLAGHAMLGATAADRAANADAASHHRPTGSGADDDGFRGAEGLAMFQPRMLCLPDSAADLKRQAANGLAAIDRIVGAGPWFWASGSAWPISCCSRLSNSATMVGQPLDPALTHLVTWRDRVAARPSAADSANHKQASQKPPEERFA